MTLPKCIRCGQCCAQAPCAVGRIRYRLTSTNPVCPALAKLPDGRYSCILMEEDDPWMRNLMHVGEGCRYPEYRQEQKVAMEASDTKLAQLH